MLAHPWFSEARAESGYDKAKLGMWAQLINGRAQVLVVFCVSGVGRGVTDDFREEEVEKGPREFLKIAVAQRNFGYASSNLV